MADIKEVQKQLEAALAENKSLKEVISTDQGRIESLKAANDSLSNEMEAVVKSRDLLTEEKEVLMKALDGVTAEREDLKAEVARLIATPDEKETVSGVGGIFEVVGSNYQVLVPSYNIPGFGIMTANDLLANPGAQAVLVKSGSGLIKSVK